ncbi:MULTISPECIES: TetR/AcrR family transcriptional regulator [Actinomadura]|nr:TetR/AcrR family transcriptional regulator [Actinomadura sp. J1-007]
MMEKSEPVRPDLGWRLPIAGAAAPERADAARNRRKILAVAEEIVATRGVDALTMNEVAAAAGVGVGTVYRRFGDLAGLIAAVMDERERQLQEACLTGAPPLGPDASPADRIKGFLHAYADLLDNYAPLMAVAEATSPTGRYRGGAYAVHHVHLARLVAEARPDLDAHYFADALLAPLSAGMFVHHRQEQGMALARVKAGLDRLVDGILSGPEAERTGAGG